MRVGLSDSPATVAGGILSLRILLMHTPFSFAFLTKSQQVRYLYQWGTYASRRSLGEFDHQLFSLHSFFVELCCEKDNNRLLGVYPLPLDLVEAFYTDDVSLEALLH